MTDRESQSFYLAVIGHDLHLSYFSSDEVNSNYQKKYLMPDTLDDNLNLRVLTKFILEKVKDFEKDVGSFIEKVNLITDAKYDLFSLSLKNKFNSNKIKDIDVVKLINDAKKLIIRNNKNCFILHILVDKYIVDGKEYFELPENLYYNELIIDLSFITVQNSIIETLNRVLKDCNIEVKKIISHQYSSRFADKRDKSPCVAGKKVIEGVNSLEVITQDDYSKKQGLFEKMFNFFS